MYKRKPLEKERERETTGVSNKTREGFTRRKQEPDVDSRAPSLLGQMCQMGAAEGKLELGERVGQGNFICSCNKVVEWLCASTPEVAEF